MKMKTPFRLLICILAACPLAAQQTAAPTFKSKIELVLVPVVVTRDGKPVDGLTKKDFQLLHDGKAEEIAVFEEVRVAKPTTMTADVLPPGTVQNYAAANLSLGQGQDVVILMLDFINGSWSTSARIRSYLQGMTERLAADGTPVTVLLLSNRGLLQVHSFTTPTTNLVKAVERWKASLPIDTAIRPEPVTTWTSPVAGTEERTGAAALEAFARNLDWTERQKLERLAMTVEAIEQIAQSFGGVAGRKKLIWISTEFAGWTTGRDDALSASSVGGMFAAAEKRERAWKALSDANIAVYPVDSNGAVNPDWEAHYSPAHGPGAGMRPLQLEMPSDTQSMLEAAEKTGGQVCTDKLPTCVTRILTDARHYYLLGFYLRGEGRPGWHKLDVKAGKTKVRARNGFMVAGTAAAKKAKAAAKEAVRPASQPAGQMPQLGASVDRGTVLTALASPLDYSAVPLRLNWSVVPNTEEIEFRLLSPAGGVLADPATNTLNVDFLIFVRPMGSVDGQSYPKSLVSHLNEAQQRRLAQDGFAYRHRVKIGPGKYEARVLLRDNATGKMGTISTVVEIPVATIAP